MKPIATSIPKSIPVGAYCLCDDNSGAKIVQIIGVIGMKGRARRYPRVGIGDIAVAAVKKGSPEMVKKVTNVVVIRQKKAIRRPNGLRVSFEDNAVAVVDEQGIPRGTEIKGVIAREVAERYPKVAAIAWGVV